MEPSGPVKACNVISLYFTVCTQAFLEVFSIALLYQTYSWDLEVRKMIYKH
jgi:hypothetical protein